MKRLLFIFVFLSLIGINSMVVFAQQDPNASTINELLPTRSVQSSMQQGDVLPTADLRFGIVPQIIKIALALTGTVTFGVFVYAGVMLLIAQGNEEEITKFKNILIWTLVGLILITTAYALVSGIMKMVFI